MTRFEQFESVVVVLTPVRVCLPRFSPFDVAPDTPNLREATSSIPAIISFISVSASLPFDDLLWWRSPRERLAICGRA